MYILLYITFLDNMIWYIMSCTWYSNNWYVVWLWNNSKKIVHAQCIYSFFFNFCVWLTESSDVEPMHMNRWLRILHDHSSFAFLPKHIILCPIWAIVWKPHFCSQACLDIFQEKVLMGTWRLEFNFLFPCHSHCITMVAHLCPHWLLILQRPR